MDIRVLVNDALSIGSNVSATFLAEQLVRQRNASCSDYILYAKCYNQNGEYRRCLAVLEHKGILSAQVFSELSDAICLKDVQTSKSTQARLLVWLSGVHLASLCLFSLEQYEECLDLLQPFFSVIEEEDNPSTSNINTLIENARAVFGSEDSKMNLMSGVFCIIGRCLDILDSKTRSICAFKIAIRIDAACTEAVDYMVVNGLLSKGNRQTFFYEALTLTPGREWLESYYRSVSDVSVQIFLVYFFVSI